MTDIYCCQCHAILARRLADGSVHVVQRKNQEHICSPVQIVIVCGRIYGPQQQKCGRMNIIPYDAAANVEGYTRVSVG